MNVLPIDNLIPDIIQGLTKQTPNAIVTAQPGSGKTTRIPPAVLHKLDGIIYVVQPRRLAAISAANRIAEEQTWKTGNQVGWLVRFDTRVSHKTRLIFVTSGMLLNIMRDNPFMDGVSCVIFDEFHERTLDMDLALSMLRYLQKELQAQLHIIIMSATLETTPLQDFLQPCNLWNSPSKLYPLTIDYIPNPGPFTANLPQRTHNAITEAIARMTGDILVFLPGVADILETKAIGEKEFGEQFELCILHASLPLEEQQKVMTPSGQRRRIIYATNVAESSLTIPNVRIVVDSGLQKSKFFDDDSGMERLETIRISQHAATQRAGRAARLGPGLCIRLWSEATQAQLDLTHTPELLRLDLSQAMLQLLSWGVTSTRDFQWLEQPQDKKQESALKLLTQLDAIDNNENLTTIGKQMSCLPLHPRLARWMIAAREYNCIPDSALIAAFLSEAPYRRAQREQWNTPNLLEDLPRLRNFIKTPQGNWIRKLTDQLCEQMGVPSYKNHNNKNITENDLNEVLIRSMMCAFPDRIARQRTVKTKPSVQIDPNEAIRPVHALMSGNKGVMLREGRSLRHSPFLLCLDVDLAAHRQFAESIIVKACPIDQKWLPWKTTRIVRYEPQKDRTIAVEAIQYDIFTLSETFLYDDSLAPALDDAITHAVQQNLNEALNWSANDVQNFIARLNFLIEHIPGIKCEPLTIDSMTPFLSEICKGKRSFKEIREVSLLPYLQNIVPYEIRQYLQKCAPTHYTLPKGYRAPIDYTANPPIIRAKIQDFFGLNALPMLCNGTVKTILHLCAPNGRVEQVTQDIDSFWKNTYPELRKLLRARYPKHAWPETPT